MIITISGFPGAGKTSVGKELAEKLNYTFYSMGDLRGELAIKKGLTIDQLNKLGETQSWTDKDIDNYQKELGKTQDNLIFEGRLSFHFIPNSLKILLKVNPRVGAERIFNDPRPDEEEKQSVEQVQKQLEKRIKSDKERYQKYYQIDCYNEEQYDLIIDTTNLPIQQIVEDIFKNIKI